MSSSDLPILFSEIELQPLIDEIPTEILCLIFELACTENLLQENWKSDVCPPNPPTRLSLPVITYLPALSISAVCTRWRSLSLALPGLWSHLKLEIAVTSEPSMVFMAILQLYLERSAKEPLHIDMFIGYSPHTEKRKQPGLDLLLKHTSRWKTIRCLTDHRMSQTPLFLPILEELTIGCAWEDLVGNTFHCFQAAPKLQALTIVDIGHSDEASQVLLSKLPLHQLTYLNVAVLLHSSIDSLRYLTNLTTLEINACGGHEQLRASLSLAHLRTFILTLDPHTTIPGHFLRYSLRLFTFPSLEELVIRRGKSYKGNLVWSVSAFDKFISRSGCILTALSISGVTLSDFDFIAALRLISSLTTLEYNDFMVTSPITTLFLSSLTFHSIESELLVPNLCSISMRLREPSFDDTTFVKMILSRLPPSSLRLASRGVASLRSVDLRFHARKVDKSVYRPIYQLGSVAIRKEQEMSRNLSEDLWDLRDLRTRRRCEWLSLTFDGP